MSERKLATIRTISSIQPIEGADAIECAVVDGWTVVVKKGEFIPGDLCVFLEIDSVLPIQPEYEFLRKSCYVKRDWLPLGEGFRLRTVKLRGQLSQGLVLPFSVVNIVADGNAIHIPVGTSVDDLLGVVKWDPPVPAQLASQVMGNFPSFLRKSDQERAQNIVTEIQDAYASGERFEITTKLDGTSCTVFYKDGEFGICSRNLRLKINEVNKNNSFIRATYMQGLADALERLGMNIAIQAELMGPGIQENREGLSDIGLFVFDIFDIDGQHFLTPESRMDVMSMLYAKSFTGSHVPVLYNDTVLPAGNVYDLLKFAEGPSLRNSVREGVVFKSLSREFSFKAISNKFLMEEK